MFKVRPVMPEEYFLGDLIVSDTDLLNHEAARITKAIQNVCNFYSEINGQFITFCF